MNLNRFVPALLAGPYLHNPGLALTPVREQGQTVGYVVNRALTRDSYVPKAVVSGNTGN